MSRALGLVPREFAEGYRWFQAHQGEVIASLPFGPGKPDELSYPLARQSGIHSTSARAMRYPSCRYAISVHSSDPERYPDKAPVELGDGMWVLDYPGQDNDPTPTRQNHDGWLLNCLEDGIPIGVLPS